MIAVETTTLKPPAYLAHQYDPANDTVEALNEWASGFFQPLFSAPHEPAFQNVDGTLRYLTGSTYSDVTISAGWWIVIGPSAAITVLADEDFQRQYVTPQAV